MLDELRYIIRSILQPRQTDRDLTDELAYHIERETDRNMASGLTRAEARRRALVSVGGVEKTKEQHRDARGNRWLVDASADVRYALRGLRHNPVLAATAILTLAVAIGANAAIFSAVDAVLLQPLPFANPSRLVVIGENNPEFNWHLSEAAPANFFDWRARVRGLSDAMAYASYQQTPTLLVNGAPHRVTSSSVTGTFFSVLGVHPQAGRFFQNDDVWSNGGAPLVVISDRLWREQFGADPAIVGKSISLDGRPSTVVGIAPRRFAFPWDNVDVWTPFGWPRSAAGQTWFRRVHLARVVARLRDGVSIETANSQLHAVAAQLRAEYPETNRLMDAELAPLHRFLVGDTRLPLLVLLGAAGLLLTIACANVGNLQLIRAAGREREFALRVALGAGRSRLIRQALTDSLVLSVIGGAAGLVLGTLGTRTLGALVPPGMLRVGTLGVDWRVTWYVLAVTVACGLLFGLTPAAWAARLDPGEPLKAGSRGSAHGARVTRWGRRLVVGEVALALVMTVGAALLARSYALLAQVDPGFDAHNVIAATIALPGTRYDSASKIETFFDELIARVRAAPGVVGAAAISHVPLTTPAWSSEFSIEGPSAGHFSTPLVHRELTGDYFRVMRVPLLRGRTLTPADRGAPYAVVINDALARQIFRGRDPVGQRIAYDRVPDSTSVWRTIVGVVGNEHQASPATPPEPEVFEPLMEEPTRQMTVVARTTGDPAAMAPAIRRMVAGLDPRLAITDVQTMDAVRDASMARERFLLTLLSMFAFVGLVLAVVGVYGIVAQLVRARRREMGIRLALGADPGTVRWLVVRYGLRLAGAGVVIGTVVALAATRSMTRLLYGVAPSDPVAIVAVAAAVLGAAFVASFVPGVRAGNVEPIVELRRE